MKLKKAAQHDRQLRAEHPGRDHGRDRIGGVVQAVQEIEQQSDADQGDQQMKGELRRPSGVVDHDALDLVGDVLEPVEHPLDMAGRPRGRSKNAIGLPGAMLPEQSALRPASWSSSAWPSRWTISSVISCSRAALRPMLRISGIASSTSLRGLAARAPLISFICGSKLVDLVERDRLGGLPHLVERIVHRRGERGDRAAVERA